MIETIETDAPKVVGLMVRGRLHDEDYKQFVPQMETLLTAAGKVRLLVQFEDFHGWDFHAAWDELRFGLKHYSDFERIAMVGDRKWERWMAGFCKPFTKASVRYFDKSEVKAAWQWLQEADEGNRAKKEEARPADSADEPANWYNYIWYGL